MQPAIAVFADCGRTVCERCGLADRPVARLRGLIGRAELPPGEGLLLRPAGSVHTLFMRFAIDVVFLDRAGRVLRTVTRLPPGRMASCRGALAVLELAPGECERRHLRAGMRLRIGTWA